MSQCPLSESILLSMLLSLSLLLPYTQTALTANLSSSILYFWCHTNIPQSNCAMKALHETDRQIQRFESNFLHSTFKVVRIQIPRVNLLIDIYILKAVSPLECVKHSIRNIGAPINVDLIFLPLNIPINIVLYFVQSPGKVLALVLAFKEHNFQIWRTQAVNKANCHLQLESSVTPQVSSAPEGCHTDIYTIYKRPSIPKRLVVDVKKWITFQVKMSRLSDCLKE